MKKNLIIAALFMFSTTSAFALNPTYMAPNASTMNFYPLMQHQMEKQESIDFVDNIKDTKQKRDEKYNKENGIMNTNFDPSYGNGFGQNYFNASPKPSNMQFVDDGNGNIKIQSSPAN